MFVRLSASLKSLSGNVVGPPCSVHPALRTFVRAGAQCLSWYNRGRMDSGNKQITKNRIRLRRAVVACVWPYFTPKRYIKNWGTKSEERS
jgi:hypothetical protein